MSKVSLSWLVIGMGGAICAFGLFAHPPWIGAHYLRFLTGSSAASQTEQWRRDAPLNVVGISCAAPNTHALSSIPVQHEWLRRPRVQYITPSLCVHILQASGPKAKITVDTDQGERQVAVADVLLDSALAREFGLENPAVATSTGLRYPTRGLGLRQRVADETHRDQTLACFGLCGFPLTRQVRIVQRNYRIADVLRDSLANFHLSQFELEWTGLAYSLYLPPQRNWTNRFGETYDFDGLASELMQRRLLRASCGGAHLLIAMSAIERVDRQHPILSPSVRDSLRRRLDATCDLLISQQRADGSWRGDTLMRVEVNTLPASSDQETIPASYPPLPDISATSHIVLLLLALGRENEECAVPLFRASRWLSAQLAQTDPEEFWKDFCSYTHAVAAVDGVESMAASACTRPTKMSLTVVDN